MPVAAVARLLDSSLARLARAAAESGCRSLAQRELLSDQGRGDHLSRSPARLPPAPDAEDLSLLHADLLAAYRALLPPDSSGWAQLPQDEPYIWEHLVYHLRGAGDGAGISALVCDLAYLASRSLSQRALRGRVRPAPGRRPVPRSRRRSAGCCGSLRSGVTCSQTSRRSATSPSPSLAARTTPPLP